MCPSLYSFVFCVMLNFWIMANRGFIVAVYWGVICYFLVLLSLTLVHIINFWLGGVYAVSIIFWFYFFSFSLLASSYSYFSNFNSYLIRGFLWGLFFSYFWVFFVQVKFSAFILGYFLYYVILRALGAIGEVFRKFKGELSWNPISFWLYDFCSNR